LYFQIEEVVPWKIEIVPILRTGNVKRPELTRSFSPLKGGMGIDLLHEDVILGQHTEAV